jgi:hypothetical protein
MTALRYIAILGRQPELGLVELECQLGAADLAPFGSQAARLAQRIDVTRFGGVVRLGEILAECSATELMNWPLSLETLPLASSKTPFAVSVFGVEHRPGLARALGLELKKRLRARGSVRLVEPRTGLVVSAAGLKHNQILEKGFELCFVVTGQTLIIARTLAVQDVDGYAERDYGRPARSAQVGMLPPKLAQILVNTTTAPVVVDPFCGTGVVLQEARLLGRAAVGSDLAAEMVAATNTNMVWLDSYHPNLPHWRVELSDARRVTLPLEAAVVSEGYLGPHLVAAPHSAELAQIQAELLDLYLGVLNNWSSQLAPGAQVSMCAPAWRIGGRWSYLPLVDELPRLGYTLRSFAHATSPLLYARHDQLVGRQLLLLRKI